MTPFSSFLSSLDTGETANIEATSSNISTCLSPLIALNKPMATLLTQLHFCFLQKQNPYFLQISYGEIMKPWRRSWKDRKMMDYFLSFFLFLVQFLSVNCRFFGFLFGVPEGKFFVHHQLSGLIRKLTESGMRSNALPSHHRNSLCGTY